MRVKNTFLLVATLFTCAWIFSLPLNLQAMGVKPPVNQPTRSSFSAGNTTYTIAYSGLRLTISGSTTHTPSLWLSFSDNNKNSVVVADDSPGSSGKIVDSSFINNSIINSITSAIATYYTTNVVGNSNLTTTIQNALLSDMRSPTNAVLLFYRPFIQSIPKNIISSNFAPNLAD